MTVRKLKSLLKDLPNNMEVFVCALDGRCSVQGVHEYDHVVKQAKYREVPCDGCVSDGHGGKIRPKRNLTCVMTEPEKTERRRGMFLDLISYDGD